MSRFFETTNASLPLSLGGFNFEFEPIEIFGGAWRGVLKVDNDNAASVLAASGAPYGVSEIATEEEYEKLKKKFLKAETVQPVSTFSREEALEKHQRAVSPAGLGLSTEQGLESPTSTKPKEAGRIEIADVDIIDDLK